MTNHLQTLPRRAALSLVILGGLAAQAAGQVQITEYMYSGLDGEFIELTNVSALPVDLEDWSLDDKSAIPGTYDLSLAGIIDPGESVLVTDRIASNFSTSWSLGAATVLGGNAIASLGRNDEIHVFDAAGATVDVLAFGDDDFPGSLRARNASAQGCDAGLGGDDIYRWTLALEGDAWGSRVSLNGDVGSPGLHGPVTCPPVGVAFCVAAANQTGQIAVTTLLGSPSILQNDLELRCDALPGGAVGYFLTSTTTGQITNPGNAIGTLCLGGSIGRYSSFAQAATASGEMNLPLDLTGLSQPTGPTSAVSGETWHFQCWYRDSIFGLPVSNFSLPVQVTLY